MSDKRALKILFDTYWSPNGWRSAGNLSWRPDTPPDDFDYAVRAGVMFPPQWCSHDEAVTRAIAARNRITPAAIGSAFVASLSRNDPARRSALGSYAVALNMPLHRYSPGSSRSCSICGEFDDKKPLDLNVLSFERHKWGGVRHDHPVYIAFDLERFAAEEAPAPTTDDQALLTALLAIIGSMPPGAKLAELLRAITPVVPGNKDQRRALIGILGFAGVVPVPDRPGFFSSFTPASHREQTPWYKDDWPYPVQWWRGGSPVDPDVVAFWFQASGPVA